MREHHHLQEGPSIDSAKYIGLDVRVTGSMRVSWPNCCAAACSGRSITERWDHGPLLFSL